MGTDLQKPTTVRVSRRTLARLIAIRNRMIGEGDTPYVSHEECINRLMDLWEKRAPRK